jgi:uncharacterized membrane protein YoaK (UPF0700 family)
MTSGEPGLRVATPCPGRPARHRQRPSTLAPTLLLTGAAGGVDAIGWLTLDELFTAHMSGNTVSMTVHVALADWGEASRRAFVIAAFVAGVMAGAVAGDVARRLGKRRRFVAPLAIEMALLLAFLVESVLFGGIADRHRDLAAPPHVAAYGLRIVTAAGAMGIQSATLWRMGSVRTRTTFVTGLLAQLGETIVRFARLPRSPRGRGARRRRQQRSAIVLLGGVWTAYACGGVGSALLERAIGAIAMALPLAGVTLAAVLVARATT